MFVYTYVCVCVPSVGGCVWECESGGGLGRASASSLPYRGSIWRADPGHCCQSIMREIMGVVGCG